MAISGPLEKPFALSTAFWPLRLLQQPRAVNVRFGSERTKSDVRFTSKSGHDRTSQPSPLWAIRRHLLKARTVRLLLEIDEPISDRTIDLSPDGPINAGLDFRRAGAA